MHSRLLSVIVGIVAVGLLLVALRAGWSTYQRTAGLWALTLGPTSEAVQGVITEALIEERRETLPPFPLKTYVIRYAFPAPPLGTMLNGEQVVTQRQFNQLGQQGDPVTVVFDAATPQRNAVAPELNFPAHAQLWLALTISALWGGVAALAFSLRGLFSRNHAHATPHRG